MSYQTGSIDKNGLARTADGKLYVTSVGDAAITGGTSQWSSGSDAAPSIAFASATTTGAYYYSAISGWGISIAGTGRFAVNANGAYINGNVALPSDKSYSWSGSGYINTADTFLGRQAAGRIAVMPTTALPAGGSANLGLCFSSTSGMGIYAGSGAPTLSAAKGSLYLRSDGSSTSTRMYVNTDGGTTWTAVTTAA